MIENIEQQLARDEGRDLKPYQDTKKLWSIGIGHCFETDVFARIPAQFQQGITDEQCDALFLADLNHVLSLLNVYVPWWSTLDGTRGPRSGVLINMGFNLGVRGLSKFNDFLGFYRRRQFQQAADDLKTTKVYSELPERYGRLSQQIISGQWV